MDINIIEYEDILFENVKKIKNFNRLLTKKYLLTDIPYNVQKKAFPRTGNVDDEQKGTISYRFHGRGVTFFEGEIEVFFNVDAVSKYQIIITLGGFYYFLKTYLKNYEEDALLEGVMEQLEQQGVFIKRRIEDLATFHVNETWYDSKLRGLPFNGENKDDTDWRW